MPTPRAIGRRQIADRPPALRLALAFALSLSLLGSFASAQVKPPSGSQPRVAALGEETAARFLAQATFGPNDDAIAEIVADGIGPWVDRQIALPATYHQPIVEQHLLEVATALASVSGLDQETRRQLEQSVNDLTVLSRRFAWWQTAMTAPDQLRQRVAFALSEIFVVSDHAAELFQQPRGLASYYDTMVRHALGNYRDLLREVTLHPVMGTYLSHLNNAKSNPETGTFPDENYSRESMQLFSIGLWELLPDGRPRLDAQGQQIPTYTNLEITELSKVFTGLGPGGLRPAFGRRADLTVPMRMYDDFHEPGPKKLLNGFVVPAGQTGMQDIEDAVDNLFHHPNVGPFIGRRLIQRLVTANPSPEYLDRISAVFANNGYGVRGDLGAVVRATLLDREARERSGDLGAGHLQEPWLRYVALLRAFSASSATGTFLNAGVAAEEALQQHPVSAPSVFNFFSPDYRPNGPLTVAGLAAPEFQITTTSTVISMANFLDEVVLRGNVAQLPQRGLLCIERLDLCLASARCPDNACRQQIFRDLLRSPAVQAIQRFQLRLDLSRELALANDPQKLVDRLALLLGGGSMSKETREVIATAISGIDQLEPRVRLGIYLTALAPEGAIID